MAAFACSSNKDEKTTEHYKDFIERVTNEADKEMENLDLFSAAGFKYFTSIKNKPKNNLKDFIYNTIMKLLDGVIIVLCENPFPVLKTFICLIERLKLHDGRMSSIYYGEVKKIVTGFMNYFTFVVDDTIKKIDKYEHFLNNKLFVQLIDDTILMYDQNHTDFLKEYQPLNSEQEKIRHQEVLDRQVTFIAELKAIRHKWEFKQQNLDIFAKEMFKASIQKLSDLLNYAHSHIAGMLADRIYEISASLGDIVARMNTNLRIYNEQCDAKVCDLIQDLYDRNKEDLEIYRRLTKRITDSAEVKRAIELIRQRISKCSNDETHARLALETRYWNKRWSELNEISGSLIKICKETDNLETDLEKYRSIRTTELPGAKTMCFDLIAESIQERIAYFREKQSYMSKTLITFFCVRGTDRALYTDDIGSYFCDEFNHQNYMSNYGLKQFHVDCYGEFEENVESEPYYFDMNGRYIIRENNGKKEKIYQCAPCTGYYKLGDDGLFKKLTEDCGHSRKNVPECRRVTREMTDGVILPKNKPLDISGTLDSESVKYLWDNYGMVLPEVLNTVAMRQPKNPIHLMSHLLLRRRFEAKNAEFRDLRKKADKYRVKVYEERKKKAEEKKRELQAKATKPSKAQDFDVSEEWAIHNQHVEDSQILDLTGYYN